ncbi:MAG: glycosyltransferase family 1 protein [Ruminiclostridium sp.]|nr:glycosyltransferase family 1 protein [Ruminiclostridium sp.]
MKVILSSFGSYGDISPFLWLAKILRDEGHTILFICNPFFEEAVRKEGFNFKPAGTLEDYKSATIPATITGNPFKDQQEQILASRRLFTHMFLNPVEDTFRAIESEKNDHPLVISHFFGYGAKLAAEKYKLPWFNVCLAPYWLRPFKKIKAFRDRLEKMRTQGTNRFIDNQLFTKPFNALREKYGLDSLNRLSNEWMFDSDTLCLFPEWMMDYELEEGIKAAYIGFSAPDPQGIGLSAEVSSFLLKYGKPIVFTPGSAVTHIDRFFREALITLKKMNKAGIFLTRFAHKLPDDLPDNILVQDFVPLDLLLDKCSALVHHGGIGTGAQALRAGIPQVVCPRLAEQAENARIWHNAGVCETIPFNKITGDNLAGVLKTMISTPGSIEKCNSLKNQVLPQNSKENLLKYLGHRIQNTQGYAEES